MKRVWMSVAYDGTNYCGWQWQPNGLSIEEVLNRELSALLREEIRVIGASRTDSGVHAWQNIAVFDTETRIPPEKICFALNQKLPEDIVIQSSREVAADYHPRKRNTVKTYEYRILNRKIPFPARRLDTYFLYFPLDIGRMREAAGYLVGEHDFKSFCSATTQAEETIRQIYSAEIYSEDSLITIRLRGNGFLTHMVRIIAGTLMKVGTGQFPPQKVKEILEARDRQKAGPRAPAKGLTLISIEDAEELAPEERVANEHWDYTVYQSQILTKGNAYLFFDRCDERDFARNLERLVKHAFQNRAERVYAADRAGRLKEGRAGNYDFFRAETPFLPEKGAGGAGFPCGGEWYLARRSDRPEGALF